MQGGIYSDQLCPICQARFSDNFKNGLWCPGHHDQWATRFRVYFKSISKRFHNYQEASRYLNGLRFKVDEGTFHKKDYRPGLPLSFENLATQWLDIRQQEMKYSSFRKINCQLKKAIDFWGDKSVKAFKQKDFQQFLISLDVGNKTKHNALSTLHQFFVWLFDNEDLEKLPKFPKVKFTLARRNTIDKETQEKIISEVYRISKFLNMKIWLGIKLLATYFNTRPGELLQIKEKDIDLDQGHILLTHTKEGSPKFIFLLDEDIELLRSFPKGIGDLYQDLYFFRHNRGIRGIRENQRFGNHIFYDYWKKACKNLGIEGVDLYGGTKHSSVQALREMLTPEQIRLASGHTTNKAFERYYMLSPDDLRKTYSLTRRQQGGKEMAKKFEGGKST